MHRRVRSTVPGGTCRPSSIISASVYADATDLYMTGRPSGVTRPADMIRGVTVSVRRAVVKDMNAIAEIVDQHIVGGVAHFADGPQRVQDWQADWQGTNERYPWLIAETAGQIVGIAYAKRFNPRAAYDWTAEVSIYLRAGFEGQGIGAALYRRLLDLLDRQGYRCLVAGITLPNPASVRLHESFGFRYLGTLERVGYKHGAWHDVGSWQRHVRTDDDAEPIPIKTVSDVLQA